MQLADFVHQTLSQIITGVAAAQAERAGGVINPAPVAERTARGETSAHLPSHSTVQLVEFDVAITARDAGGRAGGQIAVAGVKVGGFFGGRGTETANRVKFVVPLTLPHPPRCEPET